VPPLRAVGLAVKGFKPRRSAPAPCLRLNATPGSHRRDVDVSKTGRTADAARPADRPPR